MFAQGQLHSDTMHHRGHLSPSSLEAGFFTQQVAHGTWRLTLCLGFCLRKGKIPFTRLSALMDFLQ